MSENEKPDITDPLHVSGRHRDTLSEIFVHPVSHNIEWSKAIALVQEVGTVVAEHDGRYRVSVGEETEVFDRPHAKDLGERQVLDLRRMLRNAGFEPKAKGEEN